MLKHLIFLGSNFGLENQGKQVPLYAETEPYKGSSKFWVQDAQCLHSFLVWDWRYSYKVVSAEKLCSCFNNGRAVVISWKTNFLDAGIC